MKKILLLLPVVGVAVATMAVSAYLPKPSMRILKEMYEASEDKNVIVSPIAILSLLKAYSAGVDRSVQEDIYKLLLGSSTSNDTSEMLKLYDIFMYYTLHYGNNFLSASKVYVSNKYSLNNTFVSAANSCYVAAEAIDFSQPEAAAATINEWSDASSYGSMKTPVDADSLSPDMMSMLINVVHFKERWDLFFDPEKIKERDFHINKTTVIKKKMMWLNPNFTRFHLVRYLELPELNAKLIALPFLKVGLQMVIFLPDEVDGLSDLIAKIQDTEHKVFTDYIDQAIYSRAVNLELEMPMFEIRNTLKLNDILKKMGVPKIFEVPATGIANNETVKLSQVVLDAFIKIDDQGTEEYKIKYWEVNRIFNVRPEKNHITVDHPFLFVISRYTELQFVGTYTQ